MDHELSERERELQDLLQDLLDEYGYHINGFQKAMRQLIKEEQLTPAEWQMLQKFTATDLL